MQSYSGGSGLAYNKRGMSMVNSIIVVLTIVLLLSAGFLYHQTTRQQFTDQYQLLVLDTGEVFVGEIVKQRSDTTTLENIYYIPIAADELFSKELHLTKALSVIKTGNEVHGPEDRMFITNEHIVYLQNLREDSEIVSAIREYEK